MMRRCGLSMLALLWVGCLYCQGVRDTTMTLGQVLVEAKARPVCMRGDTLIYAVPAFTTYEGEKLRALLKDVPGIEVLGDGTIKARGRVVDRLLLNGHELLGLGVSTLLDNLPAGYLQNILLYNDASRREKETGIHDGTGEQVIDLVTKEENRTAWLTDLSVGGGTEHRYATNASAGRYSDHWQHMFTATLDNLPSAFGIGESFYDKLQKTVGTADTRHHNLNASVSWQHNHWEVKASAFYDGSRKEDETRNLFSAFLTDHTNKVESHNNDITHNQTVCAQAGLTWKDSVWTVHIDPMLTWNKSRQETSFLNKTYTDAALVNIDDGLGDGIDDVLSAGVSLSVNRKLGANGRNAGLHWNGNVQRGSSETLYDDKVDFIKPGEHSRTRRSSDGHDDRNSSLFTLSYTEPIVRTLKLKAEYSFGLTQNEAEHPVLLKNNDEDWKYSDSLSRSAKNRNVQQRARLSLQYSKGKFRSVIGVLMESNRATTTSNRYRLVVDTTRSTIDWCPEANIYFASKYGLIISASYGGRSRQPTIFDLLPCESCNATLNIYRGNPGLRSTFIHQLRFSLFHFKQETQRQINLAAGFDWETQAIMDRVFFDAARGIRIYQPTNVDGNRSFIASWGLQSGLTRNETLWLDMQGDIKMARRVGFQTVDYGVPELAGDEFVYSTIQSQVMQYIGLQYNDKAITIKPYGYFRYNHLSSTLVGALVQDTYIFGYGGLARYEHGSGLSVAVDIYNHSRRGFADNTLNVDCFIVDAEIAYAFLRNRTAEIRLIACDLFRNRDIVEGSVSQTGRNETKGESHVNSYIMATLTYRF